MTPTSPTKIINKEPDSESLTTTIYNEIKRCVQTVQTAKKEKRSTMDNKRVKVLQCLFIITAYVLLSNILVIISSPVNYDAFSAEMLDLDTNNSTLRGTALKQSNNGTMTDLKHNTTQDEKCKRMFEWSMIDHWEAFNSATDIDYENLPQTRLLRISRMGGPSATGNIDMNIEVRHKKLNLTVVRTRSDGLNLWHRMVPQYAAWVSLQVARRKYHLETNHTVYLLDCNQEIAPEWSKMEKASCDKSLLEQADVVINPPNNGLLWDLAWDLDFHCHNSDMFKAFRSQFVHVHKFQDPTGCFISRQGRPMRKVLNFKETIAMMKEVFPHVRVIRLEPDYTTDETVDLLYECRVLFGVHGAGHMNAMFLRPGAAVVEMWGKARPAYFRNVNMLLGQHYESITGDPGGNMTKDFHVNLKEAKAALLRARDHALLWTEENGGEWR